MDTLSLMQQLLPHLQASSTQQTSTSGTPSVVNSLPHLSIPPHSSSSMPFGFIKISPTTAVIDANCGLPTAALAEAAPSNPLMSLISGSEAALPPEAASTSTAATSASMPSASCLVQSYMAAVHAAAALQSDAFHSAFRTPFPSSQPSPSTMPPPPPPATTTTSDSFLTLAFSTLVTSTDASSDGMSKDDCSKSFFLLLSLSSIYIREDCLYPKTGFRILLATTQIRHFSHFLFFRRYPVYPLRRQTFVFDLD